MRASFQQLVKHSGLSFHLQVYLHHLSPCFHLLIFIFFFVFYYLHRFFYVAALTFFNSFIPLNMLSLKPILRAAIFLALILSIEAYLRVLPRQINSTGTPCYQISNSDYVLFH